MHNFNFGSLCACPCSEHLSDLLLFLFSPCTFVGTGLRQVTCCQLTPAGPLRCSPAGGYGPLLESLVEGWKVSWKKANLLMGRAKGLVSDSPWPAQKSDRASHCVHRPHVSLVMKRLEQRIPVLQFPCLCTEADIQYSHCTLILGESSNKGICLSLIHIKLALSTFKIFKPRRAELMADACRAPACRV